jgi:hypothetical protein
VWSVLVDDTWLWGSDLSNVIRGEFVEGQNFKIMARISWLDNTLITAGTVGTCSLAVFDLNSTAPSAAIYSANIAMPIASLATALGWTVDSTGYNFSYTVQDSVVFPSNSAVGGHRYRFEFAIPASAGTNGTAYVIADMTCMPSRLSS